MHPVDKSPKTYRLSLIAALGRDRAIGKDNQLLWNIPEDLKHFKVLTSGHPVIMGRKTWESIPEKFRPLPGRANIVVTRQGEYVAPGAQTTSSIEEALEQARTADGADELFVIGGAELYAQALPFADRLYLTLVASDAEGDTFFPDYSAFTKEISKESGVSGDLKYDWITLER